MKHLLLFIATFGISAGGGGGVGWAAEPAIAVMPLGNNAFIFTPAYGTNIGVFKTADGLVLIDPMPGKAQLAQLEQQVHSLLGVPVKFILNTHAHSDHYGGNRYFVQKGAVLLADSSRLAEFQSVIAASHSTLDAVFYHQASNSIFVGDIFDSSWHPTFYAGGLAGFHHAITAILALGDNHSLIVPGHGRPTGKAELRKFQLNTSAWVARVKQLHHAGKTVDDIKNDEEVKRILQQFNPEATVDFVPEQALVRFIERTLTLINKAQ